MRPKRALGYARVSSIAQTLGSSLEDQQASIRSHATRVGVELVTMYVEAESAGHEAVERRHQMQALMREVRAGDLVICDKLDRWSRDPAFAHTSIRDILRRGASFYAVSDACDPSTSDGDTMLNVRVMIAREEHKRIRERLVGTRNALRAAGYYSDATPPLGYRRPATGDRYTRHVLEVEPEGAAKVRRIFALCIAGRSLSDIAEALGIDRDIARRALGNRHYLGEVRDGRGGWHRGKHEPIIERDTWERARAATEGRRYGGPRPRGGETRTSEWVLRTVARCGACGALMGAAWSGANEYLRCVAGCRPYVRVDAAEEALEPLVLARLDELRGLLSRPSRAAKADTADALERLAGRRSRLAEAYELGAITRDALTERLARLDAEEAKLGAARAVPAVPGARRESLAQVDAIRRAWVALSRRERREIVEGLAVTVRLRAGQAPEPEWRSAEALVV